MKRLPTSAEVLPTHTPELFAEAVRRAADLLRAGEVVALPTETVYGLAANALDAQAVSRIYEIKGRPRHNPLIVHVAGLALARACVSEWPELAAKLALAFWPGPLTLVLPRAPKIPDTVTAGGPTVGVRWPNHAFITAVVRECGFPLAAPSANPANRVSATSAEHVRRSLGQKLQLIIDGGPSAIGIESTVLDLTTEPPRLLRPGMIHDQALLGIVGKLGLGSKTGQVLKSPGQLPKHYAPQGRLVLWSWHDDSELRERLRHSTVPESKTHVLAHSHVPSSAGFGGVSVLPHDPRAYGRVLYAELHNCDAAGAELIVLETPPERPEWQAIRDRLTRASGSLPAPTTGSGGYK